jgi:hypothetical protein
MPRCAPADNVGELTEEEVRRTMEENRSLKQLNAQLIGQRWKLAFIHVVELYNQKLVCCAFKVCVRG